MTQKRALSTIATVKNQTTASSCSRNWTRAWPTRARWRNTWTPYRATSSIWLSRTTPPGTTTTHYRRPNQWSMTSRKGEDRRISGFSLEILVRRSLRRRGRAMKVTGQRSTSTRSCLWRRSRSTRSSKISKPRTRAGPIWVAPTGPSSRLSRIASCESNYALIVIKNQINEWRGTEDRHERGHAQDQT
jgi:hypothetical protein